MRRFSVALIDTVATVAFAHLASAADMSVKVPVFKAPVAAPYNWTGFYVGAHAGVAWFRKDWAYPCNDPLNFGDPSCGVNEGGHSAASWLAGGQVGLNYQIAQWVLGAEAEFSATDLDGSNISTPFPTDVNRSRADFIGTIAGRLGFAWDRTLLYAKGGGAWVHDRYSEALSPAGSVFGAPGAVYANASETRWGWMVGGGIEYALALNWSAKIEYDYLDFGTDRPVFYPTGASSVTTRPFAEDIRQTVQLVKIGINYRFDWGRF